MKVEIFRNTVKRRGKGASFEMIKAWAEGIKAGGDEAIWIEGKEIQKNMQASLKKE